MKPGWKHAPKWANFLAQDGNGKWYWYEYRPMYHRVDNAWANCDGGRYQEVEDGAEFTLEARPT